MADSVWGQLHPEARTNVTIGAFGPPCSDRWAAILIHPAGHVMAAFYEPVAREITLSIGAEWWLERRWRDAVRDAARQLLGIARVSRAIIRFGDETETVEGSCPR